jgi:DNA (cytosine-5)-methyltransferase 1
MTQSHIPARQTGRNAFTFIDLFAGIGGFHLGVTSVGGRCVYANERDMHAALTYRAWTQFANIDVRDIELVDPRNDIPAHDVLCAGFPCQPFSIAGVSKKKSLGRAHGFADASQGNLFFRILDVVDVHRPPILFLENVKNLRSHSRGRTWSRISRELDVRGYVVKSDVVNAKGWVPQSRERIFMVCFDHRAFSDEEVDSFTFPSRRSRRTLASVLSRTEVDVKYTLSDHLWRYLQDYAKKHRDAGNGFGYRLFSRDQISGTLSARYFKDGAEILIRQGRRRNPRRLTPREAANLMGFDARLARVLGHRGGFPMVVSDTQAYKQLGNSVCPLVVRDIAAGIAETLRLRSARLDRAA